MKLEKKVAILEVNILLLVGVCFFLLGGMSNLSVIAKNDGKMPVYQPFFGKGDTPENYVVFKKANEVNLFYLGDVIPLYFAVFSIGDFLSLYGILLVISSLIKMRKIKKIYK